MFDAKLPSCKSKLLCNVMLIITTLFMLRELSHFLMNLQEHWISVCTFSQLSVRRVVHKHVRTGLSKLLGHSKWTHWSCEMQMEVGTLPNSLSEELQFYSTVHTKRSFNSGRRGGGHSIAHCHSVAEWDKAQGPRTEQRCGRVWVRRRERQVECDTEQHNAVSWRHLCLQGTELALGV